MCPFSTIARPGLGGGAGQGAGTLFLFLTPWARPISGLIQRKFPLSGVAAGFSPTAHQARTGLFSPINVRSAPLLKMLIRLYFFALQVDIGDYDEAFSPYYYIPKIHVILLLICCVIFFVICIYITYVYVMLDQINLFLSYLRSMPKH